MHEDKPIDISEHPDPQEPMFPHRSRKLYRASTKSGHGLPGSRPRRERELRRAKRAQRAKTR